MNFQFHALDSEKFAHMFALNDEDLARRNACRVQAAKFPGTPCRVSLEDASEGETVILTNYEHMPKNSPYRASHAIYVREGIETAKPQVNEVPAFLHHRLLSVRAFSSKGMLRNADVVEGICVQDTIEQMLADPQTDELHIHFAQPGCFAARVTRSL